MPLVNVMVNNRAYTIACDDGEEEHLRQLAAIVDGILNPNPLRTARRDGH